MYQFHSICHTDAALNCDVTQDKQYLGRLYVFPTTDPNFIAMGIEKEWFLAHAEGDFVISGYVNTEGQWSLSPHRSLELSEDYTTQGAIFDRVFSSEYVRDVLASGNLEPSLTTKDVAVVKDSSANGDGDSGEGQPTKFDSQLMVDWQAVIPQLDGLRELLAREVEQQEQEVISDEALDAEPDEEQPDELDAATFALPVQGQFILDEELEETRRLKVQEALIGAVLSEYQEQETTEFVLPPFGTVTVHAEEKYFVLRADRDGHTILAATLDAEVINELSKTDAAKFDEVLKQSEVEAARWLTNGDDLGTNSTLIQQESKRSQDVEYGD